MPNADSTVFLRYLPIGISAFSLGLSILSYWQSVITARLSQRAYVYHNAELTNHDELNKAIAEKASIIPVDLVLNIKNFGSTPALKLNYVFQYTIPAQTALAVKKDILSDVDIAPGDTRKYYQRLEFRSSEHEGRLSGNGIYTGVTGSVTYEDVFGRRQDVSLCYVVMATALDARISTCEQQKTGGRIPTLAVPSKEGYVIVDKPPAK